MGKEKNCRWHFAKSLGGQDQGPNEAMSENFKKDPYESLVREAIQNSLDASNDDETVIMSFKFKKLVSEDYPELFKLQQHIEGCLKKYGSDAAKKKFNPMIDYLKSAHSGKLDYLEVSDEHTTGMDYVKDDTDCGFYSFVKSAGNSSKNSATAGGSFGFGKAAYYLNSKIRTLFVSTMTKDNRVFFEGVSSLCTHVVDGEKRVPVGFYCDNDDEEPTNQLENIPSLFRRETAGTSMFVMGLGLDMKGTEEAMMKIIKATILHFWFAILRNKLRVRVVIGKTERIIHSDNIVFLSSKLFTEFKDTKRGHDNPRPYIEAVIKAETDDKHLKFERSIPTLGNVCFYMLKIKDGTDNILYLRETLMLIQARKNGTHYGFYGVFVCDDPKGNEILRNMENPAHSEWVANNCLDPTDKKLAREANESLRAFIQDCIKEAFIDDDKEFLTFGGLDEFLSIPSSADVDDEIYNGNQGEQTDNTQDDETPSPNTEVDDGTVRPPRDDNKDGKVTIQKPGQRKPQPGGGGNTYGGGGGGKGPDTGGLGPGTETDPPPTTGPNEPEGDDETGQSGVHYEALDVQYRSYAQRVGESYEHTIVIHSDRDVEEAIVTIFSGGETSEDEVDIASSDKGTPKNNSVWGVALQEGKNTLKVKFADGMRHALKVDIYENK